MESSPGCLRGAGAGMRAASPSRTPLIAIQPSCTSLPQPQRRRLTCRFGTLCTQGTASPSACGASGQCPGRPRGSAARSWCRKPGPAGHPARRTPSTGRPLNRDREEGCQDHPLAGLCPLPGTPPPGQEGTQHPGLVVPTHTHPSARPRPRARDRGAGGSSWTGSSRWRRRRGSGRGGGSRPPGTGWWPPSADSVHISESGGAPWGQRRCPGPS